MNRLKYVLLQFVLNMAAVALCVFAYRKAIPWGTEFLGADNWPLRILLGILGVTAVIAVFRWIFRIANYVLKCCGLYAVCMDGGLCSSNGSAFSVVMKRLGRAATVSIVTVAVHELKDSFSEAAKGSQVSSEIGKYFNVESVPMLYNIAKLGGRLFSRMFDYVDECIIGYCFTHEDKDLATCVVEGAACFMQMLKELSLSLITMSFLSVVLKTLYYVGFVLIVWRSHLLSVDTVIILFVVMLWGAYIVSDVFAEPLVMDNFVLTFVSHCEDCELDSGLLQTLQKILPSLADGKVDGSTVENESQQTDKEGANEHAGES